MFAGHAKLAGFPIKTPAGTGPVTLTTCP
jgi:hypothetical protein